MGYAHEICSNLNVVSPKRPYPRVNTVNRLPDFIFPISMLNLACSGGNREVTCGRLIHFPQQECSFAVAFSTASCHEAVSPWCLEKTHAGLLQRRNSWDKCLGMSHIIGNGGLLIKLGPSNHISWVAPCGRGSPELRKIILALFRNQTPNHTIFNCGGLGAYSLHYMD